jgi:hypothetical protein
MKTIDYSKLNDRIVNQAYLGLMTLSQEQKDKLIQDKLDRAAQYRESLKNTTAARSKYPAC